MTEVSLEPRFAASVLCACSGGWPAGQQAKGDADVRTPERVGLPGPAQEAGEIPGRVAEGGGGHRDLGRAFPRAGRLDPGTHETVDARWKLLGGFSLLSSSGS